MLYCLNNILVYIKINL